MIIARSVVIRHGFLFAIFFTMPKTRAQKQETIQDLTARLIAAKGAVFATFSGIKMAETFALRREAKKEGVYYTVAKKTLLGRAFKEAGVQIDPHTIEGSIAVAVSAEDPIAPARVLATFAKTHEGFKVAGGLLEGKVIDRGGVVALAALPPRAALLGQLVGTLQSTVSGFVRVLAGNVRGLVQVLRAVSERST